MIDFDAAVEVGLGVRVPLAGTDLSFDEIFAVGISDRPPTDAQARLAATLRGHLYTNGLAFPTSGRADEQHRGHALGLDDGTDDAHAGRGRGCPRRRRPGADQPGVRVADAMGLPDSALA